MGDKFFGLSTIGTGAPYMTRAWVGRLRLHIFHRPDGDPDPHDHPWAFWTFPLTTYVEEVTEVDGIDPGRWVPYRHVQIVRAFRLHRRPATYAHRVLGRWNGVDPRAAKSAADMIAPGKIVTVVLRFRESRKWGFLKTRDGRTCWQAGADYYLRGGKHAPCE